MEKKEVDVEKKHEMIVISDLKEIDPNEVYSHPELRPPKDYDDFKGSEEEKKKLEEEEKKKMIEKKVKSKIKVQVYITIQMKKKRKNQNQLLDKSD